MTDFADQQRFDKFVQDFDDDEYEKYINGDYAKWSDGEIHHATDKQIDLALQFRTPASEEEEDRVNEEQQYIPESRVEQVRMPEEVYDNRDLPRIRRNVQVEVNPTTNQIEQVGEQPKEMPRVDLQRKQVERQVQQELRQSTTRQRTSFIQRLTSFFSRFRRRK